MQLIENLIILENSIPGAFIINSFEGTMEYLDDDTLKILKKWQNSNKIIPENDKEKIFYDNLVERNYLIESQIEQKKMKMEAFSYAKEVYDYALKTIEGEMVFIPTYACNFACPYCYEEGIEISNEILTEEMVDKAFDLYSHCCKDVLIFGGEPLLPFTENIVSYILDKCKKNDKNVTIITNGYYLMDFYDLLNKYEIQMFTITLDGDKEIHDKQRCLKNRAGTFDRIMKSIDYYLNNGKNIRIRMNIDNNNLVSCINLRNELLDKYSNYSENFSFELAPLFQHCLKEVNSFGKLFEYLDKDCDEKERRRRNAYYLKTKIGSYDSDIEKLLLPRYAYCSAQYNNYMFDPQGRIYSCLRTLGKDNLEIGTYYPEHKIYEKSIYTRNLNTMEKCKNCRYAVLCSGGCPINLKDDDDLYTAVCEKTEYIYENVFPELFYEKIKNEL